MALVFLSARAAAARTYGIEGLVFFGVGDRLCVRRGSNVFCHPSFPSPHFPIPSACMYPKLASLLMPVRLVSNAVRCGHDFLLVLGNSVAGRMLQKEAVCGLWDRGWGGKLGLGRGSSCLSMRLDERDGIFSFVCVTRTCLNEVQPCITRIPVSSGPLHHAVTDGY